MTTAPRASRRPSDAASVLAARAAALAKPVAFDAGTHGRRTVVVVVAGGERFAIDAAAVQQVLRFAGLTPVPGAPPLVAGAMTLAGGLLVVVGLRRWLGDEAAPAEAGWIVVLGGADPLGVLVDEVVEVTDVAPDAVWADGTTLVDVPSLLGDSRLAHIR